MAEDNRVRRPIKWTGDRKYMPVRHHEGDAGFDLICAEDVLVFPGEFVDVDCGIRIEMPQGVWALLTGRSSTLRKRSLMVAQGIIDNGYRGDIFAGVWNLGAGQEYIQEGERIAQIIPLPLTAAELVMNHRRLDPLSETDRGIHGFGSTG